VDAPRAGEIILPYFAQQGFATTQHASPVTQQSLITLVVTLAASVQQGFWATQHSSPVAQQSLFATAFTIEYSSQQMAPGTQQGEPSKQQSPPSQHGRPSSQQTAPGKQHDAERPALAEARLTAIKPAPTTPKKIFFNMVMLQDSSAQQPSEG